MSEAEVRNDIINEIVSDYVGNWANDIMNWEEYLPQLSEEYTQFLADIALENEKVGYNMFGSIQQQEEMNNAITEIMSEVVEGNDIEYSDRNDMNLVFEKEINKYQVKNKKSRIVNNILEIKSNIFENISKKKQDNILNEYAKNFLKGKNFNIGKNIIRITSRSIGKLIQGKTIFDRRIDKSIRKELKANIITNIDKVLNISELNKKDSKDTKNHTFADYFDRYKAIVKYNGTNYIVWFNVGKKDGINTLYDLTHIEKTQKNSLNSSRLVSKRNSLNTNKVFEAHKTNNNITQKNKNVKSSKEIQKSDRKDIEDERTIQGLENYTVSELKEAFKADVETILEENGIDDVNIIDIDLHGSRLRGTAKKNSDLDVVVQYDGDIREDNILKLMQ